MTNEELLKACDEQIAEIDKLIKSADPKVEKDKVNMYAVLLKRKQELVAIRKTIVEMSSEERKLDVQVSEGKKNRLKDVFLGVASISAPLAIHHIEFNKLGKIEQMDQVFRSTSAKQVFSKMGQLLTFWKK